MLVGMVCLQIELMDSTGGFFRVLPLKLVVSVRLLLLLLSNMERVSVYPAFIRQLAHSSGIVLHDTRTPNST